MTDEATTAEDVGVTVVTGSLQFAGLSYMAVLAWQGVPLEEADQAQNVMKSALQMGYPNGVITFRSDASGMGDDLVTINWITGPCENSEEAAEQATEMSEFLNQCVARGKELAEAKAEPDVEPA